MAEAAPPASDSAASELDLLVFSGAYDEVLRRTASGYPERESPAVIAALALSGRLDEAESALSVYAGQLVPPAPKHLSQARFFMLAGLCHSGQLARALRTARSALRDVFAALPRQRYWACQGLGLVRYFEGRFHVARRFAKRALAAAVEANFPYARLLALDLLAHVSVHLGDIFAGLRLLAQAEALAGALGYQHNAATLRTAALVFQLRFSLGEAGDVTRQLDELARSPDVSYFTRRNALIELGTSFALRGEAERAALALEAARRLSLPGSDSRAKVRWLIAHALTAVLARGAAPARESLEEARACARGELTLEAEIAFVELIFFAPEADHCAQAERLARLTGSQRLCIALDIALGKRRLHAPRVEEPLGRLLLECMARAALERVEAVVHAGFLGLLPWALGRPPGRRILVTATHLITENHGRVRAAPAPLRRSLDLLYAIREGQKSRAALLNEVWGIAHFVPSRHTPTLHTAISRLRLALGEPDWVLTLDDGYALLEGVEVVNWGARAAPLVSASRAPPPDDRQRVLELVQQRGEVRSGEVAQALQLSDSTALRLLRRLSDEDLLLRHGRGRSTRYTLR